LPVFSMWRMMKYAEKQRMVMVSEIIICSMSASCNPVPDKIGGMEYTQCTGQKHDRLEELSYPVFRHRHPVAYIRKRPADGLKLFRNPVHALNGKGKSGASQAEPCGGSAAGGHGFSGGWDLGFLMDSRAFFMAFISFALKGRSSLASFASFKSSSSEEPLMAVASFIIDHACASTFSRIRAASSVFRASRMAATVASASSMSGFLGRPTLASLILS